MDTFCQSSLVKISLKAIAGLMAISLLIACGGSFRANSVTSVSTPAPIDQQTPQAGRTTVNGEKQRTPEPDVITSPNHAEPEPSVRGKAPVIFEPTLPLDAEPAPAGHSQSPILADPAPVQKDHSQAPKSSKASAEKKTLTWEAFHSATTWMQMPNTRAWTQLAMTSIHEKMDILDQARDISLFCPGYTVTSKPYRELCWLRLVSAVVQYESRHIPTNTFPEPNGNISVGLLALSPNECDNAPRIVDLKDPLRNLACGIAIMTGLIDRDGYVDGPKGHRGAASYWSVLRPPYAAFGYANLGKKYEIMAITRSYQSF